MRLMQRLKFTAAILFTAVPSGAYSQVALPPGVYKPLSTIPGVVNAPLVSQRAQQEAVDPQTLRPFKDVDLWQRVRRGFVMGELNSPLVLQQEQWYASRPEYIQRFVDRGSKYLHHIVEEVERRGMPTEVALLPIIESAFNPQAFSHAKASGMWQFIPSTGKNFGLKQDWMADNRRDVVLSTDAALDYLQKLHGMFNSWELAFAAYNCGEGCVSRAIAKNEKKGLPTDYLSLNLPLETRNYVPKLIAVKNIVLSPGSYGIELEAVENRPYFAKVVAPEKIDTNLAARLAEMPEDEFATLNPAFIRPVAASGTGYFLVPFEKAEVFRANLELYRSLNGPMVSWQIVYARRGESIDVIAKRYGMTGSYLRATNGSLKERKGKLTLAATIMVPITGKAKVINATLDRKIALRSVQSAASDSLRTETTASQMIASTANEPVTTDEIATPQNSSGAVPAEDYGGEKTLPLAGAHQVQRGETLFSISKRYGVSIEQIKTFNAMKTSSVQIGQNLLLTGFSAAETAPSFTPELARAPARTGPNKRSTYTVRSGDTLYAIAIKFAVELDDLLRWNKLHPKSILQPGHKIRVVL